MKAFVSEDIRTFLCAIDAHAPGPFTITVIGGAAAALAFRATRGTLDIDTATNVAPLEDACTKAREDTGLHIPFQQAAVFEAPYEYESRLVPVSLVALKNLTIRVPERHDWALMKIARLYDKDKAAIQEVFERVGFDKDIFLKRFREEMTHIEPEKELRFCFLTMMEELYGRAEADRMMRSLKNP